jgi:uncharacterized protein (UPF0332 family)
VKQQTSAYLDKARELLDQAETIYSVGLSEHAGRTAYLAGFHAAQALIFQTSGRIYKTHSGVNAEFHRLVKDEPGVDDQIRAFLGRTYDLKAIADYLTGPASHISPEMAREAIDSAKQFVEFVTGLMPAPQPNLTQPIPGYDAPPTSEGDPARDPKTERDHDYEP